MNSLERNRLEALAHNLVVRVVVVMRIIQLVHLDLSIVTDLLGLIIVSALELLIITALLYLHPTFTYPFHRKSEGVGFFLHELIDLELHPQDSSARHNLLFQQLELVLVHRRLAGVGVFCGPVHL